MKLNAWYILLSLVVIGCSSLPSTKDEAAQALANAEVLSKNIEGNKELNPFIPQDMYGKAMMNVNQAKTFINEKKYNEACYHASLAAIGFETAAIAGQAKMARYQASKLLSERAQINKPDTDTLEGSKFNKKGDVYTATLFDWQLFMKKNKRTSYVLKSEGKERLDKVIHIIQSHQGCKLKIVGHMKQYDPKDYSKHKAEIVAKYFIEKNIEPDRIEIIGLGNKEVIETHLGYMRVDRVELILTGLQ